MRSLRPSDSKINSDLLKPVHHPGWGWYATVVVSSLVVLAAAGALGYQFRNGLGVWGINRPVFWALDITNFVFWIGISHAGTLISAILRVTGAEWRRPVTRCAEAITVFALMIGALFPIIHLGRPQFFYWLVPYPNERGLWPNFRSPLAWDFFAINTYLLGSIIYLYLPLIPDLALLRNKSRGLLKKFYGALSLGWSGTDLQWDRLERAVRVMAVVIIPVAVSVHTIVSWDFAMTIRPMWHSPSLSPRAVSSADSFQQSRIAAADDEPDLVLLHLRRIPDRVVRQRTRRDGRVQFKNLRIVCAAVLGERYLLLHHSGAAPGVQTIKNDQGNHDRIRVNRRWDVARAIFDHRADAYASAADLQLGNIRSNLGRDRAYRGDIRVLCFAVCDLHTAVPYHRDLGVQGRALD